MRIKGLNRAGRVPAIDSKITGEEPEWTDAETISLSVFHRRKDKALRFYAYYCDNKFFRPIILNWMKINGYSQEDITLMSDAPVTCLSTTAGKLIRMMSLGMQDIHHDDPKLVSNLDTIKEHIANSINSILVYNANKKNVKPTDDIPTKTLTALERQHKKIEDIVLPELESIIDQICALDINTAKPKNIPKANMASLLNGISPNAVGPVIAWLEKNHIEFWEAYEKRDDQLVEGYDWLSRPLLRRIVDNFSQMLEETKTFANTQVKRGVRKPRAKKVIPPEKQVAKLKYEEKNSEYTIESENPKKIIGAQRVFLFNTKTRTLTILNAKTPAGLKVNGSTIKEFEPDCSNSLRLRKPDLVLPVIKEKTARQIDKYLNEQIKTKRGKATGRSNETTIILRTFNKI